MEFTSGQFLGFILVVVLLINVSRSPSYRKLIEVGANLFFIGSYVTRLVQVAPLAGFLVLGYVGIEAIRRRPSTVMLVSFLVLFLSSFIVLKRFSFLDGILTIPFLYLIVGLSYILFRVLHLMIDARAGELERRIDILSFFDYTCNFLCFVSGPIQRYQDYAAERERPVVVLNSEAVFAAFSRIIIGFVKVSVISAIANYLFANLSPGVLAPGAVTSKLHFICQYLGSVIAYTFYLYYNFSGYMDVVIGIGWLIGRNLPENFNRPFLAPNFLDFWARWHMTLSTWFKLYVFNPLVAFMMERYPSKEIAPYIGVIAFFVTFLIMGIWHGTTIVFVIYGLLMGAGASLNKLWQVLMTKRLGKKEYRALGAQVLYLYTCRGMTCAYFSLAVTCLWVDLKQLSNIAATLSFPGLLAAFVLLTAASAILFALVDFAKRALSVPDEISDEKVVRRHLFIGNLKMAACVLLILSVMSFFHKSPEFVYKAF